MNVRRWIPALLAALLAAMLAGGLPGSALARSDSSEADLKRLFTDHTLVYRDRRTGEMNSLYFGRFGNFDRYFPCEFTDGTWWIGDGATLCLKDSSGNGRPTCLKPRIKGDAVTFFAPGGEVAMEAKLLAGNRLPFG